ncbi:MAG: hypothetical protein HUN04_04270 [Desulfobacter sp.]|nr:MAG: hypothetical protein HUN04_04270 [Desulfobacter sp.]
MRPICFFPFTRMTPDQARTMGGFFEAFKVLSLDRSEFSQSHYSDLVDSGRLEPVAVDEARAAALEAQVHAFKDWAAIHRGNEKNLKALIREKTWLKDENGVAAIQSQIRSGGAFPAPEEEVPQGDPLLVLRFAEILDMENKTIRNSLQAMDENNAALFAELKGELEDKSGLSGAEDWAAGVEAKMDPLAEMNPGQIEERIRAWCAVAGEAGCLDPEGDCTVLATTSSGVMDYLAANSDRMINGLDIDSIKVHEHGCGQREEWLGKISNSLEEIVSGNSAVWPEEKNDVGCSCPAGGIRVCSFPGGDLNKTFNIPGRQLIVCLVKLNS